MRYIYIIVILLVNMASLLACKDSWLDAKPDKALVVPATLEDFQALLNNRSIFGRGYPSLGEASADNSYMLYQTWLSIPEAQGRNVYIWADDIFEGETSGAWIAPFTQILYTNVILEGINNELNNSGANLNQYNSVKGQALFHNAFTYYCLSQIFCKAYQSSTADTDLGLPIRLSSNVNDKVSRSTLQQTYDHIIGNLLLAKELLPEQQINKTLPTKSAVSGLLARIYLSMENYSSALLEANESLNSNNKLLDYAELDTLIEYPIPVFNDEVIWHAELSDMYNAPNFDGLVDTMLYGLYTENDLRKALFFEDREEGRKFTGSYRGARWGSFCGIATDELYLIKAECLVRSGKIQEGINVLNNLLKYRWAKDDSGNTTYIDQAAIDETDALRSILMERRKELILRGVRWSDLRRLNRDERFRVTLIRELNGKIYTLPPDDLKYTLPIPPDEIRLSGLEQNPR